jgi:recombinational DNA repair ATPase RecF
LRLFPKCLIQSIKIKDFRVIDDKQYFFNPDFNVIIGENAVGKTSLLEAIAVGLGGFVKGLNYKNGRSIVKTDVRITSYKKDIIRAPYSEIIITAEICSTKGSFTDSSG